MYDFTKILRITPSEYREMSVTSIQYYVEMLSDDINNKDPFIIPAPKLF